MGTRAGGRGRAGHRSPPHPHPRALQAQSCANAGVGFLSSLTIPVPLPPFLSLSPTPDRYRELSGVSFRIFLQAFIFCVLIFSLGSSGW